MSQPEITISRVASDSKDFKYLIHLLDEELNARYGVLQAQYDKYNKIEALDTVVVGYLNNQPIGCGCFKVFDADSAEIKRMFVKPEYRGKGIAQLILRELEQWATENNFSGSVLETGIKQPEAIRFYSKLGYVRTENYGQYIGNENSVCMRKELK